MLLFNEYQSKESLANLKRLYAMAKNCPFCGEKPIFNSVRRNRTSNEFVVPFDFYYLWAGREQIISSKCCSWAENVGYIFSKLPNAENIIYKWNKRISKVNFEYDGKFQCMVVPFDLFKWIDEDAFAVKKTISVLDTRQGQVGICFKEHTQKDKVLIYCENQEYEPAYTNRYIIQVKRGKE